MSAQTVAVLSAALATLMCAAMLYQIWRSGLVDEAVLVPPVPLLSVTTVAWATVTGVLAAGPDRGGTYLVLVLAASTSVGFATALSRARQLRLRTRSPQLRLALDGLMIGTALTICVWFIAVGPRLVDADEARRVITGGLLLMSWSSAGLTSLHLILLPSARSLIYAVLGIGNAVAATDIACAWPGAELSSSDALLITVGALAIVVSRMVALAALLGQLPSGLDTERVSRSAHQVFGHDADALGVPTVRELSPSTIASIICTIVLLPTLMLFPVPPDQAVPLTLVVLLMVVFAVREYLSTSLREQLNRGLRRQALTDPLTGLTNRRGLTQWLSWVGGRNRWVVTTIDVDGFKQVNELLGYETADALLATVGHELSAVPAPGLASRVGGDEFVVITPGGLAEGEALAEELRVRLAESLSVATTGVPVTASIGVGRMATRDARDTAARDPLWVLGDSASALQAAKAASGDRVVSFTGGVAQARDRHRRVESRLRAMVSQRSVRVAALPVIDLRTGQVDGVEALARWDDQVLGPIAPGEFVPIAEQNQLMQPLGEQILRRALDEAAALDGAPDLSLTVNVSLAQLRRPDFVDLVATVLEEARFPASRLIVDVPESTVISEDGMVSAALILLAEQGVRIAIDDFGTGYLALSCLQWLPVHALKVDRRLTETPDDPRTLAVVQAVVEIAHDVGLTVVMEGVSTPALAQYWRGAGADAGQGYALAPPLAWGSMARLVREGVPLPQ